MLRRSSFKPQAPPRRDRSDEFASFVPSRPASRMVRPEDMTRVVPVAPKLERRVQQEIRDAARDEECTVRIPGVCCFDPARSVWSHVPSLAGDRGMGLKALDLCGAICCDCCHDVVDGRVPEPAGMGRAEIMLCWFWGHLRSLVRLRQKGIV